jgi:hypothetical protein
MNAVLHTPAHKQRLPSPDFNVGFHGSIPLLQPLTVAANGWVERHLPTDALFWGTSVVIEPRYLESILEGIEADGLYAQ